MRESHYLTKAKEYGIGQTRLKKILELFGTRQGKRILDVGCATGYLGRQLKERGNYVAGIEISSEAALQAQKVLDRVSAFDIERPWPTEMNQEKFDIVIMAEILEHTFDPVEVLKSVRGVLKDDGEVIITTPNFMTWTNRLKFLVGHFQYENQGMFDFGHIRWFTYRYLQEVLKQAGFQIEEERHIIFPGKLSSLLKHWPSIFASQFILKARKV